TLNSCAAACINMQPAILVQSLLLSNDAPVRAAWRTWRTCSCRWRNNLILQVLRQSTGSANVGGLGRTLADYFCALRQRNGLRGFVLPPLRPAYACNGYAGRGTLGSRFRTSAPAKDAAPCPRPIPRA